MRRGMIFGFVALFVGMPLGALWAQGDDTSLPVTAVVGGDIRIRTEYKRPFDYFQTDGGDPTGEDGTFLRTRVHFGWELANDISVFLQAQDSRAWGVDIVEDADADVDMRQAYIAFADLQGQHGMDFLGENDVDVRVGRSELPTFGDGYILHANPWANTGPTAYDGLWFDTTFGGGDLQFDVDLLYADLVNNDPYVTGALGTNEGAVLWGLQAGTDDIDFVGGDVYFWTFDGDISTIADFDVQIYGVRLYSQLPEGSLEDLKVVFEYAMQSGDAGALDVDASLMVLRAQYALGMEDLNPILGLGMSIASGDTDPADGDLETWFSPLDVNHDVLGHYDLVDNSNVQDIFLTSQVSVMESMDVHLDFHLLTLDEEDDGWYTLTGNNGGAVADDDLGTEIDLYAVWECGPNLVFQGGWSMFMPGDGAEQSTPSGTFDDSGNFFYLQMTVPFGHQNDG